MLILVALFLFRVSLQMKFLDGTPSVSPPVATSFSRYSFGFLLKLRKTPSLMKKKLEKLHPQTKQTTLTSTTKLHHLAEIIEI